MRILSWIAALHPRRRWPLVVALAALAGGLALLPARGRSRAQGAADFVHFESGHVHPIAMTPDGTKLLAVNTADARLAVFDLTTPQPTRIGDVEVGLEPVSVAARTNTEAWVVNTLSDDVSIVDLATLQVRATLRVGDEPHDVVFAGNPERAFVSVGEEDAVKAYDPGDLGAAPTVIAMPGRMPRALARSADGSKVIAAIFLAGNETTVVPEDLAGDSLPPPSPTMAVTLPPAPRTALIVHRDPAGNWRDESGKLWNSKVPYRLTEADLVTIDANARGVTGTIGGLAAINLGLDVNPIDGSIATTGHEAHNSIRFEINIRGRNVANRLCVVRPTGPVVKAILNPHIDYSHWPGTRAEADSAIGMPTGVAWTPDGTRLYVTSMATDRIGLYSPTGGVLARRPVVAGPTGVLPDAARGRVYVLGRFANELQTLSAADLSPLSTRSIGFDPTPPEIAAGRRLFYAGTTSAHGDQSCASCHLFGDADGLAWDLGDPRGPLDPRPPGMADPLLGPFHPMKGPMVTQSLRGLVGTGRLHWRADRENLAAFNPAFVNLLGRGSTLTDAEMASFSDFVLALAYPPNPHQRLDRSFPDAPPSQPSAERGRQFFLNRGVDGGATCNFCHTLPRGTNGQMINANALLETQDMKIPQLRGLYRKTGFDPTPGAVSKRGFGFLHNGEDPTLFEFLHFPGFAFDAGAPGDAQRRDIEAFLLAFDSGMAPAVGHQITFDPVAVANAPLRARLDTLTAQAEGGHCDLIAKGRVAGVPRGWKYVLGDLWMSDRAAEPALTTSTLLALATASNPITVTGVPAGSGTRQGIDRDRDGFRDGDERLAGSDPGDPASRPDTLGVPPGTARPRVARVNPNPMRASAEVEFVLPSRSPVELVVHDLFGRTVRVLARDAVVDAGVQRMTWDGRDGNGRALPAGAYIVRLRALGTSSSRIVVRVP